MTVEQPDNADEILDLSHLHWPQQVFDAVVNCRLLLNWEIIDRFQRNTNASFSLVRRLAEAKNVGEIIELQAAHASNQFSAMIRQAEEIAVLCLTAAVNIPRLELRAMWGSLIR